MNTTTPEQPRACLVTFWAKLLEAWGEQFDPIAELICTIHKWSAGNEKHWYENHTAKIKWAKSHSRPYKRSSIKNGSNTSLSQTRLETTWQRSNKAARSPGPSIYSTSNTSGHWTVIVSQPTASPMWSLFLDGQSAGLASVLILSMKTRTLKLRARSQKTEIILHRSSRLE